MSAGGEVKKSGAALGVGVLVGFYAYARATKAANDALRAGVCANAPPGALQSLGDAIKGVWSNFAQDLGLGAMALGDLLARLETLGIYKPDGAAEFYAWWNGLTPAQQAQVRVTEDGNLYCAAAETGAQLATGAGALTTAAVAGLVAYVVADLVLEE